MLPEGKEKPECDILIHILKCAFKLASKMGTAAPIGLRLFICEVGHSQIIASNICITGRGRTGVSAHLWVYNQQFQERGV